VTRKRLLPALLAAAALAVVLASCGGGGNSTVTKTTMMMLHKSQRGPQGTYLPDVTGRNFVKPSSYSFGGDGNLTATKLEWHGWGEAKATAFGTIAEHPANGLVDTFSGSVTASAPKVCKGARYYTKVMAHLPKQADYVPTKPTKLPTPCD
jgi:hypothetical protein